MSMNENVPGNPSFPDIARSAPRPGLHPLHEAALRIADIGLGRSRARTRDVVSMLLAHGARAFRGSQPLAELHLHVRSPAGRPPVRLRLR